MKRPFSLKSDIEINDCKNFVLNDTLNFVTPIIIEYYHCNNETLEYEIL